MNTDARRKASAAFHAKRKAEGWRKVTVWLHPDTMQELDRRAKVYGSREAALAHCINHPVSKATLPTPMPTAPRPMPAPGPSTRKPRIMGYDTEGKPITR